MKTANQGGGGGGNQSRQTTFVCSCFVVNNVDVVPSVEADFFGLVVANKSSFKALLFFCCCYCCFDADHSCGQ